MERGKPGEDYSAGRTAPFRGCSIAAIPADAVTTTAGLNPQISAA
jgi:potassium-transporting ATPase KdpC subunit